MAKFVYRFEGIKNIKKTLEKKLQKELKDIENRVLLKQKDIEDIDREREALRFNFSNRTSLRASEAQLKTYQENYIDEKKEMFVAELKVIELEKVKKMEELAQKSKEFKIFDTLKEKHLLEHNTEQKKADIREIDEIATSKFIRDKR